MVEVEVDEEEGGEVGVISMGEIGSVAHHRRV